MVIFAKDAEAGRRYRCVDTGDVIEICAKSSDIRNGKLTPLTTADGSFIHVNAISTKNKRIRERHLNEPLALPSFYKLEPYDGPYTKGVVRRTSIPTATIPKTSKMGRPKKGDTPWRGWALATRYDMERILEAIEDEGFWLDLAHHYYSVGYKSKTCMVVYRSGQLGFQSKPIGPLGHLPMRKPSLDPYMPWKIELGPVMAAQQWEVMLDLLRRHLREFKQKLDRQRVR
jgi:hypothetical protein